MDNNASLLLKIGPLQKSMFINLEFAVCTSLAVYVTIFYFLMEFIFFMKKLINFQVPPNHICAQKSFKEKPTHTNGRAKKSHLLDKNAISAQFFWVGTKSVYWHVPGNKKALLLVAFIVRRSQSKNGLRCNIVVKHSISWALMPLVPIL